MLSADRYELSKSWLSGDPVCGVRESGRQGWRHSWRLMDRSYGSNNADQTVPSRLQKSPTKSRTVISWKSNDNITPSCSSSERNQSHSGVRLPRSDKDVPKVIDIQGKLIKTRTGIDPRVARKTACVSQIGLICWYTVQDRQPVISTVVSMNKETWAQLLVYSTVPWALGGFGCDGRLVMRLCICIWGIAVHTYSTY